MTIENWINVAMIIAVIMTAAATLIGPVLAAYVQVRMSQPKPTPDVNQPAAQRESRVNRFLDSSLLANFILISMLVAGPVLILAFFFLPLSRTTIAGLVFGVSGPVTHSIGFAIKRLTSNVSQLAAVAYTTHMTVYDGIRMLSEDEPPPDTSK
ncbi:MAG TPA: hypothetical protein VN843_03370 [Anaerolineales bacterium]|nr:hypothetical protein [Anaerolineales bacterium]